MSDPTKPDDKTPAGKPADATKMQAADPVTGAGAPLLTEADKTKIREEVLATLRADQKKSAAQRFRDQEMRRLKMEEGLVVGGVLDEMVNVTMDLAEHSANVLINMQAYWHGRTYTVPRHVANTLAEVMYRGWCHQYEIDGKSRRQFYQAHRATTLSPVGVKNAPQRAA